MTDAAGGTSMTTAPFAWTEGTLDRRKVVQCALSRVCGGCGESLGRPIAFVGTDDEVARNVFHAPPMHSTCALHLVEGRAGTPGDEGEPWRVVLTSGFEFVRPAKDDADRAVRFVPNSLI